MEKKLIFCDIDGTIYSPSMGITDATKNAIKAARENGHLVYVNTGRSWGGIQHLIQDIPFDGYVCANGTYILTGKENILDVQLTQTELRQLTDTFVKESIGFVLEGSNGCYFDRLAQNRVGESSLVNDLMNSNYYLWEGDTKITINKISGYAFDEVALNNVIEEFESKFKITVYRKKHNYHKFELNCIGYDKASGIRQVCNHINHPFSQTIGIGDSYNDFSMFDVVATSISMGNGPDALKKVASMITLPIDQDGFFHALKKINIIP